MPRFAYSAFDRNGTLIKGDISAPDDSTVVFTVSEPTPNLLSSLGAFKGMAVVRGVTAARCIWFKRSRAHTATCC